MSKYEAEPETSSDFWHVRWPAGGNAEPFTEAEANIIAFALNAIAEGRALFSVAGDETYWELGGAYTGPTDGVAP